MYTDRTSRVVATGRRVITGLRAFIVAVSAAVIAHSDVAAQPKPVLPDVGSVVLELAPGPGNPRNSEGSFLALHDGSILFVYSRFTGTSAGDAARARLSARRSSDGGRTWSDDVALETPEEDAIMNIMSVSLLRFANGDAGLFYLLRRSWHDLRMYCRRSTDEGRTWGEPVCCMPAPDYFVVNNDRVIRLTDGRIIIPAAWHRALSGRNEQAAVDWRGIAVFFSSDDDGRTWRQSPGKVVMNVPHTRSGLQEPGVVELGDGLLWGWARTDLGRQYEFFSHDRGATWSEATPARFTSPKSPLSMKRIPGSGRLLAVWNPIPAYETRALRRGESDRNPLVWATGADPTSGWRPATVIEKEEGAGYCYTAMHFTEDAVLLAYCAGGPGDGSQLARLRVRRLPLSPRTLRAGDGSRPAVLNEDGGRELSSIR